MEADQLEGKLLARGEVEGAWKTMVLNMRAKMLGIGTRAAPQAVAAGNIAEAAAMIDQLVGEALNELAEQPIDAVAFDGRPGADLGCEVGDGAGGAAAEADGLAVG